MTSSEINHSLQQPPVRQVSALHCYGAYISALAVGILTWWLFQSQNWVSNQFYMEVKKQK